MRAHFIALRNPQRDVRAHASTTMKGSVSSPIARDSAAKTPAIAACRAFFGSTASAIQPIMKIVSMICGAE